MKCSKCGAEIADNEKFCGECGAPRPTAAVVPVPPAPSKPETMADKPGEDQKSTPKTPDGSRKKPLIWILGSITAVVVLCFLALVLGREFIWGSEGILTALENQPEGSIATASLVDVESDEAEVKEPTSIKEVQQDTAPPVDVESDEAEEKEPTSIKEVQQDTAVIPTTSKESLVIVNPRELLPPSDIIIKAFSQDLGNIYLAESDSTTNQELVDEQGNPPISSALIESWGRIAGDYDFYLHEDGCQSPVFSYVMIEAATYESAVGSMAHYGWIQEMSKSMLPALDTDVSLGEGAHNFRYDTPSDCQPQGETRHFRVVFIRKNVMGSVDIGVVKDSLGEYFSEEDIMKMAYLTAAMVDALIQVQP